MANLTLPAGYISNRQPRHTYTTCLGLSAKLSVSCVDLVVRLLH